MQGLACRDSVVTSRDYVVAVKDAKFASSDQSELGM